MVTEEMVISALSQEDAEKSLTKWWELHPDYVIVGMEGEETADGYWATVVYKHY